MSLPKPHSFYFSTEINTTDKTLPTVNDNMELVNFNGTHKLLSNIRFMLYKQKGNYSSLRMQECCVVALLVFSRHYMASCIGQINLL
jgi:hypothetical protein